MSAKRKQELLVGLSIFLMLCSIGFSFQGSSFLWFWQQYPFIPMMLVLFAFFAIRYWLKLEVDKQRQQIEGELKKSLTSNSQTIKSLLSKRELEVLQHINDGLSNKEIAEKLHVSLATVKTHINNIYKLLDVKTRREAIEKSGEK